MFLSEDRPGGRTYNALGAGPSRFGLGYGRFLQADPVGYDDQLNVYAYVGNDPLNGTDPTGMCTGTLLCDKAGNSLSGLGIGASGWGSPAHATADHTYRDSLAAGGAAAGAVLGGAAGGAAGGTGGAAAGLACGPGAIACSPAGAAAAGTAGTVAGAAGGGIVGGLAGGFVGNLIDKGIALFNKASGSGGEGGERVQNPTKQDSPVWQRLDNWRQGMRTDGKNIYSWDHLHNDIEVFNSRGQHLGSMNPTTGEMYKPPVAGRIIPK